MTFVQQLMARLRGWGGEPEPNPSDLSPAQLDGSACASCAKSWPAPTVQVGRFPDGKPARCCPECASAVTG